MGIPAIWDNVHSLICYLSGQSTAAQHPPAPWLISGTLGRVLCCLLPFPNTVFSSWTYEEASLSLSCIYCPSVIILFSLQFFFCLHTFLGSYEQRAFSFIRDWLRPITFGEKSTRNRDQLQALRKEYMNRAGSHQYFPDFSHGHLLISSLLRQVQSLFSFEIMNFLNIAFR